MAGLARTVAWRGTAALAVLLIPAGVAFGAGGVAPWQPAEQRPLIVPVVSPSVDLVCPSPVLLATGESFAPDDAVDPQFDPSPVESVAQLTALSTGAGTTPAAAEIRSLDGSQVIASLPGSDVASVVSARQPEAAAVVHAEGGQDRPVDVAGSVVTRTDGGDLRGLVAASCRPASGETWLVGGSTSVQSSARLVLQNPGRTAATVAVSVWGPAGQVDLAAAPELLVPAGTERSVLLEGLAVEQPRIVVRVASTGGAVSAYLQDSALDGLAPAGVSDVVAGRPPALRQVVPGVAVSGEDQDPAILRLLVPGDENGTARVTVMAADGSTALPGAESLDLVRGEVLDVPLGGLAAGTYTLVVDGDVPILAGAMVARSSPDETATTGIGPAVDRAWSASTPARPGDAIALPRIADWTLTLALPEAEGALPRPVEIEVIGVTGNVLGSTTRSARPGRSITLDGTDLVEDPGEAIGVVVRAEQDVAWSVTLEVALGDGQLVAVLGPVARPFVREAVDLVLR